MKILFIGCGSIGKRHINNIKSLYKDNVEIIAYRTFAKSRHLDEDFFRKNNITQYSSLTKALSENPDVTFITNPTSLHIPVAIKAAEAGSHLFIEKPISNSMKGIKRLQTIIKKKKLTACVGFNMRFYPILNSIDKALKRKEIGDIISIRAEVGQYLPEWHQSEDYSHNYSALKELGGGVILDLVHEIDYVRWLASEEINQVFCYGGKYSKLKIETEDVAEILLRTNKSILSVHVDYLQYPMIRRCTIIGTTGKIEADIINNSGRIYDNFGSFVELSLNSYFEPNFSYIDELSYFFYCIKHKIKYPIIDIDEGINVLKIALAAKKSMNTEKPINL